MKFGVVICQQTYKLFKGRQLWEISKVILNCLTKTMEKQAPNSLGPSHCTKWPLPGWVSHSPRAPTVSGADLSIRGTNMGYIPIGWWPHECSSMVVSLSALPGLFCPSLLPEPSVTGNGPSHLILRHSWLRSSAGMNQSDFFSSLDSELIDTVKESWGPSHIHGWLGVKGTDAGGPQEWFPPFQRAGWSPFC